MRFNILGSLEIFTCDNRPLQVNASKTRQVLALLLIRNHTVVGVDTLIEELWGDDPPRSALATLRTYIHNIRRLLAEEEQPEGRDLLATRQAGYVLHVDDDQVDAKVFEQLIARGRMRLERAELEAGSADLRAAVALWRGPAIANVGFGGVLGAHAIHLEEMRIQAINLRITAEKALGRDQELIPELRSLAVTHPYNEVFHAQLIESLYRSGRRAEALQAYQRLHSNLDRDLGIAPAPEIQRLHEKLTSC
ncbi:BTAD domain-containing putative transcriptional regulator [Nocardiopsis sediminis]|uniref:BTAD domain-containing putative transcriptional regulator n=1 Tax=Nocardiopsis sediminis TaxID=1778267 RepID=A0ABV8FHL5_9ACTN